MDTQLTEHFYLCTLQIIKKNRVGCKNNRSKEITRSLIIFPEITEKRKIHVSEICLFSFDTFKIFHKSLCKYSNENVPST